MSGQCLCSWCVEARGKIRGHVPSWIGDWWLPEPQHPEPPAADLKGLAAYDQARLVRPAYTLRCPCCERWVRAEDWSAARAMCVPCATVDRYCGPDDGPCEHGAPDAAKLFALRFAAREKTGATCP